MSAFAKSLFGLTLVVLATGCVTWKSYDGSVEEAVASTRERKVRVTLANGSVYELHDPWVQDTVLVGSLPPGYGRAGNSIHIPTRQILRTEVRGISATRVAAGVGATLLVVAAIASRSERPRPRPRNDPPPVISCPLVYSWDGSDWRLDSETFGGAITASLARTDIDNLEALRVVDGRARLRVANEMPETDYLDEVRVMVVEHPLGTTVAPGSRGGIHVLGAAADPLSARDDQGADILSQVSTDDGWAWESTLRMRDPTNTREVRDGIELEFARPPGSRTARLIMDGHNTPWSAYLVVQMIMAHGRETSAWYASLDADPTAAHRFKERIAEEAFLRASVWTDAGWASQGVFWEVGPEISKRQVLAVDLSNASDDVVRVRLDAPPALWRVDRVRMEFDGPEGPEHAFRVTELTAASAVTAEGRDVLPLVTSADGHHLVMETGDMAELVFEIPDAPQDRAQTVLLKTHGWYRAHTSNEGAPDWNLLRALQGESGSIARHAVERLNQAVAALAPVDR